MSPPSEFEQRLVTALEAFATKKRSDKIWDYITRFVAPVSLACVAFIFNLHNRVSHLESYQEIERPWLRQAVERLEVTVQSNNQKLEDLKARIIRIEEKIAK